MVTPIFARQRGTAVRTVLLIVILFFLAATYSLLHSHTAHALPSIAVNLPTGKLLTPVTNTVNDVTDTLSLPVTVNSTSPNKPATETVGQLVTITPNSAPQQPTNLTISPTAADTTNQPVATSPDHSQAVTTAVNTAYPFPSTLDPRLFGLFRLAGWFYPQSRQDSGKIIADNDFDPFPIIIYGGLAVALSSLVVGVISMIKHRYQPYYSQGKSL